MPWLLLIFSLPSKRTSERVGIWRKLQKYGTLALRNSGYVLPNTPANQERLEWLATAIRGFKGEASVLQVLAIDDLPSDVLKETVPRRAQARLHGAHPGDSTTQTVHSGIFDTTRATETAV